MPHKYNAVAVTVDGHKFDSKAESRRWKKLLTWQAAGIISDISFHPTFELQPSFTDCDGNHQRAINYEADFSYFERGNPRLVVEDVKGFETQAFLLKKKMFLYHYPEHELRIVK